MRWEDVLPPHVALRQTQWERRTAMLRMRDAGFTLKACADRFGISTSVLSQHIAKMERRQRWAKICGKTLKSPIEEWMNDKSDLRELRDFVAPPVKPPKPTKMERMAEELRAAGWVVAAPE